MKNWDEYRLILALHRTGTLRGAANLLGVNHSTVSRRLASINKPSGEIFERTVDGYRPTTLGNELISTAERIESITIAGERQMRASKNSMSGPINLSIPPPFAFNLLLKDLKRFSEQYPDIQLNVSASFQLLDLDRSEADIVIRGTNTPPEYLVGRRLAAVKLNYYAQREYFQNTESEHYKWIGRESHGQENDSQPDWIAASPYPDAPVGLRSNDILMRHHFALTGCGLSRSACFMAETEPSLIRISDAKPMDYVDLWLLIHPDLKDIPRMKVLMQFLTSALLDKQGVIEGAIA